MLSTCVCALLHKGHATTYSFFYQKGDTKHIRERVANCDLELVVHTHKSLSIFTNMLINQQIYIYIIYACCHVNVHACAT